VSRTIDTDVVVVGSGATGGWVCKTLTEQGLSVTLLEAGPPVSAHDCPVGWYGGTDSMSVRKKLPRQAIQARHPAYCDANQHLFADDVDNPYIADPTMPFVWIRARCEGGRSNLWGGQCWRLTDRELAAPEEDGFDMRWPLAYEDIAPSYEEVERFHGIRGRLDESGQMVDQLLAADAELTAAEERACKVISKRWGRSATPARTALGTMQPYRDAGRWPQFSSLGSTLPAALKTGRLQFMHNSIVSRMQLERGSRRVQGVRYINALTGREDILQARAFVLCASTVETTRILLHSAGPGHRQGLGNSSGVLGRFLMDHNASYALGQVDAGATEAGSEFIGGRHGIYLPHLETAFGQRDFLRGYGVWLALGRAMGHGLNAVMTAVGETLPYADFRCLPLPTLRAPMSHACAHINACPWLLLPTPSTSNLQSRLAPSCPEPWCTK
jgi:choline dehydrogenase-like flavoprotein